MRPVWTASISFGLMNIPVSLYSGERRSDIQLRLVDSRDQARIRYQRINEVTGEEVPWDQVVRAYEYDKDSYVVLNEEELKEIKPETTETIDLAEFVPARQLNCLYFEKPYLLEPGEKSEKSYALLRETLKRTESVGIGTVVIRSRQYLVALLPGDRGMILNLLRFPQEIRREEEFKLPSKDPKVLKLSERELKMAEELISTMTVDWRPEKYRDDYREALKKYVEEKRERGGRTDARAASKPKEKRGGKVINIMSLLEKSLAQQRKARKPTTRKSADSGR